MTKPYLHQPRDIVFKPKPIKPIHEDAVVQEKYKHIKKKTQYSSEYYLGRESLKILISICVICDLNTLCEKFCHIYKTLSPNLRHTIHFNITIDPKNKDLELVQSYFAKFGNVSVSTGLIESVYDGMFSHIFDQSYDVYGVFSDNVDFNKLDIDRLIITYLKFFPNADGIIDLYGKDNDAFGIFIGSNYVERYLDVWPNKYFGNKGISDLFAQAKYANKFSSIPSIDWNWRAIDYEENSTKINFDNQLFKTRQAYDFGIIKPELSILIPTVAHRRKMCTRVFNTLNEQCRVTGIGQKVEVLSILDEQEITIGQKRNELLSLARGKYLAFIDDDDFISIDYIRSILEAIKTNTDAIAFKMLRLRLAKMESDVFELRHDVLTTDHTMTNGTFKRFLNHLCPIRSSIAKQFKFLNLARAEDTVWLQEIIKSNLVKTCTYINQVLYVYHEDRETSLSP